MFTQNSEKRNSKCKRCLLKILRKEIRNVKDVYSKFWEKKFEMYKMFTQISEKKTE